MKLNQTHFEIIIKFIIVGINTLNYYIVYLLLLKLFHVNYMISHHIAGFLVSFVISYYLNCYFVYKVRPTLKKF